MPTTINADTVTGGAVVTGDTSGVLQLQSGGVTGLTVNGANVTTAGNLTVTGSITATGGGIPSLASPLAVTGNSTAGAEIRLPEDTDNGSNYVALKAPNSLASNLTLTLPTADGTSGQVLQTDGAGQLSFATAPSGSLILVQTVTSSTDTIDITGSFSSTYRIYKLYLTCQFTNSNQVLFYFYLNGSLITNATHGYSGYYGTTGAPTLVGASGLNGTYAGSLTGKLNVFELTFFNPSNSTNRAPIGVVASGAFDGDPRFFNGQFFNQTAGTAGTRALTGIRATTGGDTGTWTAKLYGIKE